MFISSNFFFYLKFLLLWIIVITADFITELRFEYCWPFWLLVRSVYDSYKYKGLVWKEERENPASSYIFNYLICLVSGIFVFIYLYCDYIRSNMFIFYPSAVVILCRFHVCLDPICLAHRSVIFKFLVLLIHLVGQVVFMQIKHHKKLVKHMLERAKWMCKKQL